MLDLSFVSSVGTPHEKGDEKWTISGSHFTIYTFSGVWMGSEISWISIVICAPYKHRRVIVIISSAYCKEFISNCRQICIVTKTILPLTSLLVFCWKMFIVYFQVIEKQCFTVLFRENSSLRSLHSALRRKTWMQTYSCENEIVVLLLLR